MSSTETVVTMDPAVLADAQQDVVHTDNGVVRAGRSVKASTRPTEAQCSWGCHYVGDRFIRYWACTVHGASGKTIGGDA